MLVNVVNKTLLVPLYELDEGDFFVLEDHIYQYQRVEDYSAEAPVKAYDFNLNMYASIKNTRLVTVVKPNQIKLTVEL